MNSKKAPDPHYVHDRESFFEFVRSLCEDRKASKAAERISPSSPYSPDAGGWENITIESFLEAALAWAEDSGKTEGRGLASEPSWRSFAIFLLAGKYYE